MKQTIQKITIKNPCHENWDRMAESGNGRFCDSCNKNVIDFTGLSNQQILNIISGQNHLCGKFDNRQLDNFNRYLAEKQPPGFSWKRLGLATALFGLLPFMKVEAQVKAATESRPVKRKPVHNRAETDNTNKSTDSLVCKSLLPHDITTEPVFHATPNQLIEMYGQSSNALGGLVVYPVSFPHRVWNNIKWKIKSIFGN